MSKPICGKYHFTKKGQQTMDAALTLFYPRRCPACDGILLPKERWLCKECSGELAPILSSRCKKCGKPLPDREIEYCKDCLNIHHLFREGFAAFSYSGKIQGSLLRFKAGGRREYAPFYGRAMFVSGQDFFSRIQPEVLIPIPANPIRRVKRGYNQAELLARALSLECRIPVDAGIIRRKGSFRKSMKVLNHAQRRKQILESFARTKKPCPYRRVLLVDDIYTTGSTIDAAARILLGAGVQEVYFACAAIGRNH